MGENVTFDLSVSALKAGICKKIVENGKNDLSYGGLWVRGIEEPTFHQKMWGLWVAAALKIGGLWSLNICITFIMVVPPGATSNMYMQRSLS